MTPETDTSPYGSVVTFRGYAGGFRDPDDGTFTEILKGIDLSFRRGVVTALVGETGSGKTMAALSILGLTARTWERTAGSIWFDGQDLCLLGSDELGRLRGRKITMVFQDSRAALNPVFTIGSQLADVIRLHHGGTRSQARARAGELLRKVHVSEPSRRLRQYPHELSGGTAQRVQLAMALACDAELLLLDEPTTGLDVTIQAEILDLIVELTRSETLSVVLITHDLGVVAQTCDDVVVMRLGEICESGPVERILTSPAHPYTAELVAAARAQEVPA